MRRPNRFIFKGLCPLSKSYICIYHLVCLKIGELIIIPILETKERTTKPLKTQELDINMWQVKVYKMFIPIS